MTSRTSRSACDAPLLARTMNRRTFVRAAALGTAALVLGAAAPAAHAVEGASDATNAAIGSAQAAYNDAIAQLSSLTEQAELAQYSLSETEAQLADTNAQIADLQTTITEKQAELSAAQDVLADRIDASYKAGDVDVLSMVLDATSFEDLVNRIFYANKTSDADAQAIQTVKDLKAELEQQESDLQTKKAEQEELLAQQTADAENLQAQVYAMQSYSSSLSQEVIDLMDQAQQEALANQAQQYQDYLSSVEQGTTTSGGTGAGTGTSGGSTTAGGTAGSGDASTGGGDTSQGGTTVEPTPNPEPTPEPDYSEPEPEPEPDYSYSEPEPEPEPDYSWSSGTGNHVGSAVDVAWNYIGVPYVWGGTDPSGFDCSGLAQYCYAMCGYSIERTTYGQISQIQSLGNWRTDMSQLSPGDLVFPHSGHVGIYCGGGMMIHAPSEGRTVEYASVYAFMGGGCPV